MKRGSRKRTSRVKGQTGNPGGRPKKPARIEARKAIEDVKALAREITQEAIDALRAVVTSPSAPLRRRREGKRIVEELGERAEPPDQIAELLRILGVDQPVRLAKFSGAKKTQPTHQLASHTLKTGINH